MIHSLLFVIVFLGGLNVQALSQDVTKVKHVDWASLPYTAGEVITYTVYYNWGILWVPAGEVKFETDECDEFLTFRVTGRSFSSYDNVFKVRDYYISRVDKETLLPVEFKRDILEGNYVRFDSIGFQQDDSTLVEYFGKTKETAKRFDFEVGKLVHDMVSVIYDLRTTEVEKMTAGDRIPVSLFFDKTLFDLDVNFLGLKKKKIKNVGKCSSYHLQPELIDGYVFKEDDLMDIWVSTDGNRIPLLIESPITIGSVKAIISGTSNLKYENPELPKLPY